MKEWWNGLSKSEKTALGTLGGFLLAVVLFALGIEIGTALAGA